LPIFESFSYYSALNFKDTTFKLISTERRDPDEAFGIFAVMISCLEAQKSGIEETFCGEIVKF
jgi:hypothetical protein